MTYKDSASALMAEDAKGIGRFVSAQLQIEVAVTKSEHIELLDQLNHKANQYCFIANSLNFPITHTCKGVVHSSS